jgi:Ca-activated chloride channel homolog
LKSGGTLRKNLRIFSSHMQTRRSLLGVVPFTVLRAQDAEPIRVEVRLVNVPFTVSNSSGKLVNGLSANDFAVFEDGVEQKISFFQRTEDSALTLCIVADDSNSQSDFLKDHRRDLKEFLQATLREADKVMLLAFLANVYEVSSPIADAEELVDALKDFQKAEGGSRYRKLNTPEFREDASSVFDAVVAAAGQLRGLPGRRAIVMFSDGEDTSSAYNLYDAVEAAQDAAATFFALRYTRMRKGEMTADNRKGTSSLQRLARETGGLEFDAARADDLRSAFRSIGDVLRNSYTLAYNSSNGPGDDTFRKISIRSRQPGLIVRHKSGYLARRNP